jgi:hypothetical protein
MRKVLTEEEKKKRKRLYMKKYILKFKVRA